MRSLIGEVREDGSAIGDTSATVPSMLEVDGRNKDLQSVTLGYFQDHRLGDVGQHLELVFFFDMQEGFAGGGKIADIDQFAGDDSGKGGSDLGKIKHGQGCPVGRFGDSQAILKRLDGFQGGGIFFQEVFFPRQIAFGLFELGLGLLHLGRDFSGTEFGEEFAAVSPCDPRSTGRAMTLPVILADITACSTAWTVPTTSI